MTQNELILKTAQLLADNAHGCENVNAHHGLIKGDLIIKGCAMCMAEALAKSQPRPKKKEVPEGTVGELSKYDYENGYNQALEDCAKSQPELMPLDIKEVEDIVARFSWDSEKHEMTKIRPYDIAEKICAKFGKSQPEVVPLNWQEIYDIIVQEGGLPTESADATNRIMAKFAQVNSPTPPLSGPSGIGVGKPVEVKKSEYDNNGFYKKDSDAEATCWHCKKTFLCDVMDATCRLCGAPFAKERCKEFNFVPREVKEPEQSAQWPERKKTASKYDEGWNACHKEFMAILNAGYRKGDSYRSKGSGM